MPFTPDAAKFLFENYLRNDKEWFKANKEIYDKEIITPMRELIVYLTPLMKQIDSRIECSPRCITRIYRDARLIRDGMFFKRDIWFSLRRPKDQFPNKAEFFFWISGEDFGWGLGYYNIPSQILDNVRTLILNRDKTALEAIECYEAQDRFVLDGQQYKRDRYPNEPPQFKNWLNRRNLAVLYRSDDPAVLCAEDLYSRVYKDFESIAPIYPLFIRAEELGTADGSGNEVRK